MQLINKIHINEIFINCNMDVRCEALVQGNVLMCNVINNNDIIHHN